MVAIYGTHIASAVVHKSAASAIVPQTVDGIASIGDNDIFDFDFPLSDSHFDVPLSDMEDESWAGLGLDSPRNFTDMRDDESSISAATIDLNHHDMATSLVRQSGPSSLSLGALSEGPPWSPARKSETRPVSEKPPRILNDYSSVLVEYYFKEVAGIFSCYNGDLNPFRTTVSKLWQSSDSVFYVLQSMSAACLSDVVPSLHAVGYRLRNAAMAGVEADIRESRVETGSLLTLIMLGLSAPWHNANDLGFDLFKRARALLGTLCSGKTAAFLEANNHRNLRFFQEAMIYWEMLLSYVSDVSVALPPAQGSQPLKAEHSNSLQPNFPHPWTGVGREAQVLAIEVGRLVRKERLRIKNRPVFTSLADVNASYRVIQKAKDLARQLQELQLPSQQAVVDPGDAQTPVEHLLALPELYRLTGLLQLYRVFPDLLAGSEGGSSQSEDGNLGEISPDDMIQRLAAFAVSIVDLLRTLPIESATKCVQPFFFVTVASELRMPPVREIGDQAIKGTVPRVAGPSAIEILEARKFVISRLSTFEHVLPAKPLRQMRQIVTYTWGQIDKGVGDVYWMDVMTEMGWETILG